MKKNLLVLALLVLCAPVFLSAQDRVVDNAGLLSGSQEAELERRLAEIASIYDFDLVIVTETSIGNTRTADYADDFFDNRGYGLGQDRDGCLFLQVTGSRDYWFSTSGRGVRILNNTAGGKLESDVRGFLRNGDAAGAYRAYIRAWEEFLALEAKGRNYNHFHRLRFQLFAGTWIFAIGLGFMTVQAMKAQMNTALPKKEADSYVIPGSLAFTAQQERFLYSTVTKTKRSSSSSSSSGSGGRTSSSGRRHGGRGGKY